MKIGDKVLVKATNEIAVIEEIFTGSKGGILYYARCSKKLNCLFPREVTTSPTHKEFMSFLDNNPPNTTPEPKELTKIQKELIWLADFEAEQRYNDINNSFHL
jgi:hypothetical protein